MVNRKEETFVVRIQDCQNSTWQGSVLWAEKQQKQYFPQHPGADAPVGRSSGGRQRKDSSRKRRKP